MMTATDSRRRASPWNQIPRGGESEPEPSVSGEPPASTLPPSIAEDSGGDGAGGGNSGKRQAWNKQPPNGVSEIGPVMGAESWPALGESARVSTKSSSDSLKGLSEGVSSNSLPQVTVTTVSTTTTSSPRKQPHSTSAPNHQAPTRQKSMKRSNSNASSNGALPQQHEFPSQVFESFSNNPSPRESTPRSGFGSHSHSHSHSHTHTHTHTHGGGGGGDPQQQQQQRGSYRNRNGSGSHPRGDHQNYGGGRRDQDRGNHDWNSQNRSFNGRDSHIQQQRIMPRPIRGPPPPPSPPPFYTHHGMRPYGPPMPFPDMGPQVIYFPHHQFIGTTVSPIMLPVPDPQLPSKVANQIDYYFSNENLVKDVYLRKLMSKDGGWISIDVIKEFQKVKDLTDNVPFILDALRSAKNVEVQGDQIRKRNDWMRWIIITQDVDDALATSVQGISLEERNANTAGGGQGNYQANGDAGADSSFLGRN